jgi:ankyrin repeat protein
MVKKKVVEGPSIPVPKWEVNVFKMAEHGQMVELKKMIAAWTEDSPYEQKDPEGRTIFACATRGGQLEMCEFFVKQGALINVPAYQGFLPIHFAAMMQKMPVLEFLIAQGADVTAADAHGNTPLHYASRCPAANPVKWLIAAGANAEQCNNQKQSALHLASYAGLGMIMKALVDLGANVNLQDKRGNTPLHYTVRGGHAIQTRLLLTAGADVTIEDSGSASVQSLIDATSPAFKEKMAVKVVGGM